MKSKRSGKQDTASRPPVDGPAFRELVRKVYHRCRLAPGKVSAEQFERIQEAARWTPSLANRQPWILAGAHGETAREILERLARAPDALEDFFSATKEHDATADLHSAGALIVVLGQRGSPFWRESCLVVAYQLMLAAACEGLAARTLMPRSPNEMGHLVRVPSDYLTASIVLVGHPGEAEADTQMLKAISEVSMPIAPDPDASA